MAKKERDVYKVAVKDWGVVRTPGKGKFSFRVHAEAVALIPNKNRLQKEVTCEPLVGRVQIPLSPNGKKVLAALLRSFGCELGKDFRPLSSDYKDAFDLTDKEFYATVSGDDWKVFLPLTDKAVSDDDLLALGQELGEEPEDEEEEEKPQSGKKPGSR
jgi:hypothetical protein